jgi:hypothetical protein
MSARTVALMKTGKISNLTVEQSQDNFRKVRLELVQRYDFFLGIEMFQMSCCYHNPLRGADMSLHNTFLIIRMGH